MRNKSFKIFRDGVELGKVIMCYDARDAVQIAYFQWGRWKRDENGEYVTVYYDVEEIS